MLWLFYVLITFAFTLELEEIELQWNLNDKTRSDRNNWGREYTHTHERTYNGNFLPNLQNGSITSLSWLFGHSVYSFIFNYIAFDFVFYFVYEVFVCVWVFWGKAFLLILLQFYKSFASPTIRWISTANDWNNQFKIISNDALNCHRKWIEIAAHTNNNDDAAAAMFSVWYFNLMVWQMICALGLSLMYTKYMSLLYVWHVNVIGSHSTLSFIHSVYSPARRCCHRCHRHRRLRRRRYRLCCCCFSFYSSNRDMIARYLNYWIDFELHPLKISLPLPLK